MTRLLALPNELFLEIAAHLPLHSLAALLQTSQRLHHLLRPLLLKRGSRERPHALSTVLHHPDALRRLLLSRAFDPDYVARETAQFMSPFYVVPAATWYDPSRRTSTSGCALHKAVLSGNLAAVRILVDAGADVNLPGRYKRDTPLRFAVENARCEEMVALLLAAGADLGDDGPERERAGEHARDGAESLLQIAARNEDRDIVRLLLDAGGRKTGAAGEITLHGKTLVIA